MYYKIGDVLSSTNYYFSHDHNSKGVIVIQIIGLFQEESYEFKILECGLFPNKVGEECIKSCKLIESLYTLDNTYKLKHIINNLGNDNG